MDEEPLLTLKRLPQAALRGRALTSIVSRLTLPKFYLATWSTTYSPLGCLAFSYYNCTLHCRPSLIICEGTWSSCRFLYLCIPQGVYFHIFQGPSKSHSLCKGSSHCHTSLDFTLTNNFFCFLFPAFLQPYKFDLLSGGNCNINRSVEVFMAASNCKFKYVRLISLISGS